ncbi:glycosyltransferase family 2 protein [Flavobacterium anhuiense]|uniref:glycosyltransferase family 2 protein n=1 Tax=Flavobacterium anhuiense TaxID=459526 RepID=UPI003D95BCF2
MISVVIRNKNEAVSLEKVLIALTKVYGADIDEIVLVDNNSTDQSMTVAQKFNCNIVTIENFTYGKALNLGIETAKNQYVLLLSSHAMPIGSSFFTSAINDFKNDEKLAGLRFINSFQNYERALKNDFKIYDGLSFGLMNACAMINKKVWQECKFDESLVASEDKEWSKKVLQLGYNLKDCAETYFYFINRNKNGSLKRWEIETIAHHQLHNLKYPSIIKLLAVFIKKIIWNLPLGYFKTVIFEIKKLLINIKINRLLLKHKNNFHER